MIYVWIVLLTLVNILAWLSNLVSLPGNWLILIVSGVYAWFFPEQAGSGMGWIGLSILAGCAVLGEVIEFAAGAALAGKRGGSRRGMALAVVGTAVGSLAGAMVSLPIPILGPIVGALAGGAGGAFAGAWVGEVWKGKSVAEGAHIGTAAMIGRLLGTSGKLVVGAIMVVIATVDAIW
ncbi:MAG: DUF456 family protein [Planctomycetota bacterium]